LKKESFDGAFVLGQVERSDSLHDIHRAVAAAVASVAVLFGVEGGAAECVPTFVAATVAAVVVERRMKLLLLPPLLLLPLRHWRDSIDWISDLTVCL